MVSIADVKLNNTSLASAGSGLVAAFVGATGGIGLSTLKALLRHTDSPTVFVVGRDASRLRTLISDTLQPLNVRAKLIPIDCADLTLVASAARAADAIAAQTPRLDLLIMSPGFLLLSNAPAYTAEGLDRITSIRYHARMRFVLTLLPALRAAPSPRVVTVFGAGKEGPLHLDDLGMTNARTYSAMYAMAAVSSMTALFFESLAADPANAHLVFAHTFPGIVLDTDLDIEGPAIVRFLQRTVLKPFARSFSWLIGTPLVESGERTLFVATSGQFRRLKPGVSAEGTLVQPGSDGRVGSGVYIVRADSSAVPHGGNKDLRRLRDSGAAAKVYEYTMAEMARIEKLAASS